MTTSSARPVHTMGQSGDAATTPEQKEALKLNAETADQRRDEAKREYDAKAKRASPARATSGRPAKGPPKPPKPI